MTQDDAPSHPGPVVPAQRHHQPIPQQPPPISSFEQPAPAAYPEVRAPSQPPVGGRPRDFPGVGSWLLAGLARNLRGVLAALVATWFYLPFALLMAALGAVVLGLVGFFGGSVIGPARVPGLIADLPVLGAALEALLSRSGGVFGGLIGVVLGLLLGFIGALLLFWELRLADDPVTGFGSLLGVVAFGLLVGLGYTVYRITLEGPLLRAAGARRMSRRERELVLPIVQQCTRGLGLANHPPVLVSDDPEPVATAYCRHLVVSRGLLATLRHDRDQIAGVVAHLLVHWRNGDPVAAAFVRGVALPLYLVQSGTSWVRDRVGHPVVVAVLWLLLWPVLVTVRLLVIPLQAAEVRRAEHRADQGAVLAGRREGLRAALDRLPPTFEAGRNGWQRALCATGLAQELRLELLEDPAHRYPLAEPESRP